MSATSYLDRFLEPVTEALTTDVARTIVGLRADDQAQVRIAVFREKAESGTLTPEEAEEYRDFVEVIDVLSIIQSKARKFVAQHPESGVHLREEWLDEDGDS